LRRYRDKDYVQTTEEYLFCVVGPVHPSDRVIAYLKYVPDPSGRWGKTEARFRRVLRGYTTPALVETLGILESHPDYLYESSVLGIKMSAVPLKRILVHFRPEEKMSQLRSMKRPDALQRKVVDLADLVSDESGVPIESLGITGSVLLDIHQVFSDIDLVVYGMRDSRLMKETLIRLFEEQGSPILRFSGEMAEKWCREKVANLPLTYEEAQAILETKWGRGQFEGTMFSVHPVKIEEEVSGRYGDRTFRSLGLVTIEATVCDSSEADFLPSIYKVRDAKIVEGTEVPNICEVASYDGLYGGIAGEGESIVAHGKLERVTDKKLGKQYHRVLVGSIEAQGKDYIKPVC